MPANYTEDERENIRRNLIATGFQTCKECGLKGMTVSNLALKCNIAKGTFFIVCFSGYSPKQIHVHH